MIGPGFADPVLGAQAAFRALLEATAYPGRVRRIAPQPGWPAALPPAMAALALTLCDQDTPLWQDAGPEVARWLAFHTGAPPARAEEAAFLLCIGAPPPLAALRLGSDEAPQDGATLLLAVASLQEGQGRLTLEGPGIAGAARLEVGGLPPRLLAERAALAPLFPRGLDLVLCAGESIVALPRSIRITEAP
ncbi:MAG: phosphonate C-P lyase system protein PhnH [Rhodovarius sp.]|nr:phosphonate C-P lyase system protein PhnH [Rhodovarius sp.]MCX7932527.1 phosphonate C-P lyase system protein PhnH [Rhodovarius sp.]MDW8314086.1 phosphonate C-P lyase system protein PhnH [Rhodovarius sp.]